MFVWCSCELCHHVDLLVDTNVLEHTVSIFIPEDGYIMLVFTSVYIVSQPRTTTSVS
jgi:hypothetical protein